MKKVVVITMVLCLFLLIFPLTCLAADVYSGDEPSDNSAITDNPNLSDADGSVSDLLAGISSDPSDTANYQAIADVYAGENLTGYKVFVDGELIDFSQYDNVQPVLVNGRILVPIRAISEGMGTDVAWDSSTNTISITQASNVISLTVDSSTAYINGSVSTLDFPAELIGGRTMVPLRFVGTALGEQVGWYPSGSVGVIALFN